MKIGESQEGKKNWRESEREKIKNFEWKKEERKFIEQRQQFKILEDTWNRIFKKKLYI